ncbi:hypothetical protein GCK72_002043 [Caenorhabditis remanei]|uniref:C2H2-type domain-containing protein n=1 Tax=Caenorhabditis remanei TaxID=31234 RepID=A0A6A5HRH8_CAERE|nr:hypothetical protein GCK72_002043 [Caenorhabditis remanei]KAF1770225.1 hypothetical protein GCK72_002043 [Caenorhabditis remanei]
MMTPKSKIEEAGNQKPETLDQIQHPEPRPDNHNDTDDDDPSDDPLPEKCDCCRSLREHATPVVGYVNISKSDVIYDRTFHLYKLESLKEKSSAQEVQSSSTSSNTSEETSYPAPTPATVRRQLDRFEESRIWDLIGLTSKMYSKLSTELKRVSPKRIVFKKCAYRLHNTRHFQVPLTKRGGTTKEEVLKQKYEDDRKLLKKNQAFDCPWTECPLSFQDPQDMRIHYMFDHESIKLFCCGKRYENYDSYLEHYCTTMNGDGHPTWMARECWGCGVRYVDANTFYLHAERCDAQINPFPCPDPLCGIRFEVLTDVVDHFYIWHDKAGAIVFNDVVYPTRDSIQDDLQLLDDGQLVVNYPLRSTYTCQLCHLQFATDKYYHEHISSHVQNPQLWLAPTILYCSVCNTKNCRFQRECLIRLLPDVIETARNIKVEDCQTNPILMIWRLYLSKKSIETLEMVLVKLIAEHKRLEKEEQFLDQTGHPPCDDKRLAYVLNSMYFLYTVPYKSDQEVMQERLLAWSAKEAKEAEELEKEGKVQEGEVKEDEEEDEVDGEDGENEEDCENEEEKEEEPTVQVH